MEFEIYVDHAAEYRWRLRASNGQTIADSAEGYKDRADCERGVVLVKSTNVSTPVRYSTLLGGAGQSPKTGTINSISMAAGLLGGIRR